MANSYRQSPLKNLFIVTFFCFSIVNLACCKNAKHNKDIFSNDIAAAPDSVKQITFLYNFESDQDLENTKSISEQGSKSGTRSCSMTEDTEFSPTFNKSILACSQGYDVDSINVSFYVRQLKIELNAFAVLSIEDESGKIFYYRAEPISNLTNNWSLVSLNYNNFSDSIRPGFNLKVYIWNPNRNSFYLDDLKVSVHSKLPLNQEIDFVSLENDVFKQNGKPFFPLAINFMVNLQTNGTDLWPASCRSYNNSSQFLHTEKSANYEQLRNEFRLMKDIGFNTVRIVSIGELDVHSSINGDVSIKAYIGNLKDTLIPLDKGLNRQKYYDALQNLFDLADECGLKVIFLTRIYNEYPSTTQELKMMAQAFRYNSSLFAYDLFNEPLYFDSLKRDKRDVMFITHDWGNIVRKYAPNHLSTIGLTGIREVFEWDPNILGVDFLSMHPYEYELDQVRNEMYWYGHYIDKPWIIGETAIPADGDSVKYETQKAFAESTIIQSVNCNAIGYSWWQFKDTDWFEFHSKYMGVLSNVGVTFTSDNKEVKGTLKPIANSFKDVRPVKNNDSCLCLNNYYNYSEGTVFSLKGQIVNNSGQAIEGAVVMAWNEDWTDSYHTVTKRDGTFELKSTFPFYHWIASATYHSVDRGHCNPNESISKKVGNPFIDLGKIVLLNEKSALIPSKN